MNAKDRERIQRLVDELTMYAESWTPEDDEYYQGVNHGKQDAYRSAADMVRGLLETS